MNREEKFPPSATPGMAPEQQFAMAIRCQAIFRGHDHSSSKPNELPKHRFRRTLCPCAARYKVAKHTAAWFGLA